MPRGRLFLLKVIGLTKDSILDSPNDIFAIVDRTVFQTDFGRPNVKKTLTILITLLIVTCVKKVKRLLSNW